MSFIDTFRKRLRAGRAVTSLLAANISVWLAIGIVSMLLTASGNVGGFNSTVSTICELPGSFSGVLHAPWTLLTYMFTQFDFLHLLINCLLLWWFGSILESNAGCMVTAYTYFAGGIAGGFAYILFASYMHLPESTRLVGASGAVMAIMAAAALLSRMRRVYLLAIAVIAADMILATAGSVAPRAAHLGGALAGVAAALAVMSRRAHIADNLSHISPSNNNSGKTDVIIDKLRRSGYSSLSPEEKKILFTEHTGKKASD